MMASSLSSLSSSSSLSSPSSTTTVTSTNTTTRRCPTDDDIDNVDDDIVDLDHIQKCRRCHASTPSVVTDWAQGDRVCRNCGIVQDECLRDTRPEWRSYADTNGGGGGDAAATTTVRCGMIPNDEGRFWGGLEPTTLSLQVFGGSAGSGGGGGGSGSNNSLANLTWRKRLLSTHRKIEKLMQQEHVRSMKDAKVAQQLIKKRQRRWDEEIARRRRRNRDDDNDDGEDDDDGDGDGCYEDYDEFGNSALEEVRPDYEALLLREEEEAQQVHATLYAAKWSLDRALLLHDGPDSVTTTDTTTVTGRGRNTVDGDDGQQQQEQRKELWHQLDKTLRQASQDIYQAYTMLTDAAQRLELPHRITREALQMLCRYAAKRDGLLVKGVSSRIVSIPPQDQITTTTTTTTTAPTLDKNAKDDLAQRLRAYNKLKQIGSLCSALLFLTARNLGWTRSLLEVCDSFQGIHHSMIPPSIHHTQQQQRDHHPTTMIVDEDDVTNNNINNNNNKSLVDSSSRSVSFIRPKHCSRAMNEIKKIFPDFCRSVVMVANQNNHNSNNINRSASGTTVTTAATAGRRRGGEGHVVAAATAAASTIMDDEEATGNFLTHALRKLHLPPVAEESIRTLVRHCRQEQVTLGRDSGTKLSTLTASLTFFCCMAGATMQRLAEQGRAASMAAVAGVAATTSSPSSSSWMVKNEFSIPRKRPAASIAHATTTAAVPTNDALTTSAVQKQQRQQQPPPLGSATPIRRKRLASQLLEKQDSIMSRKRPAIIAAKLLQQQQQQQDTKSSQLLQQQDKDKDEQPRQVVSESSEKVQRTKSPPPLPPPSSSTTTRATTTTTEKPSRKKRRVVQMEDTMDSLFDDPIDSSLVESSPMSTRPGPSHKSATVSNIDNDGESKNEVDMNEEKKKKTKKKKSTKKKNSRNQQNEEGVEPFDVFSHPAVVVSSNDDTSSERQAYEMRRMWDTWTEQMPWNRSLGEIENSCGVSKSIIWEAYKSKLYPRRVELLTVLQEASGKNTIRPAAATTTATGVVAVTATTTTTTTTSLSSSRPLAATPLASTLLSHITAAAPLLSKKEKP